MFSVLEVAKIVGVEPARNRQRFLSKLVVEAAKAPEDKFAALPAEAQEWVNAEMAKLNVDARAVVADPEPTPEPAVSEEGKAKKGGKKAAKKAKTPKAPKERKPRPVSNISRYRKLVIEHPDKSQADLASYKDAEPLAKGTQNTVFSQTRSTMAVMKEMGLIK
jgi:hypothetical protein